MMPTLSDSCDLSLMQAVRCVDRHSKRGAASYRRASFEPPALGACDAAAFAEADENVFPPVTLAAQGINGGRCRDARFMNGAVGCLGDQTCRGECRMTALGRSHTHGGEALHQLDVAITHARCIDNVFDLQVFVEIDKFLDLWGASRTAKDD